MSTPGTTTYVPSTFTDLTHAQLLTELKRLGLGLAAASGNLVEVAALIGQVATGGYVHTQDTPSASWVITHTIGRLPSVTIYQGGEIVDADITATTTTASVAFPTATTGYAILT